MQGIQNNNESYTQCYSYHINCLVQLQHCINSFLQWFLKRLTVSIIIRFDDNNNNNNSSNNKFLCQLPSTEEECFWEYSRGWHQLRTIHKYLGRQGWADYWCFLTSSLYCLHCPTVFLWTCTQSDNIYCKAAWLAGLKYFLAWGLALICWSLGMSTSDNKKNNNNNLIAIKTQFSNIGN